ncbi:MAG: HAMP domain-containing sensor histidine kinase, partial [Pseudomonadota bacterium]
GEQVVAISAPVVRAGQVTGVLMLSTEPGDIGELLSTERLRVLAFAIVALLATLAVSLWLARTVAQPLRELSEVAEDVSADISASERLPTFDTREDEVGQLARSFDKMTQTLRTRLQASERFAADVAHELKNPLAAARSMSEALPLARTEEQKADCIEQIQVELARLNRLITDVSDAQRLEFELPIQQTHLTPLADIVENTAAVFKDLLSDPERNVTVRFSTNLPNADTVVRCHEGRIGQVMTNLIDNAGSFSPDGSTVDVSITDGGHVLRVIVEDEGPGLDPDQIKDIFKRFYTYRPTELASRGTNSGLGLSIAREIVEAHKGRIWAENRSDRSGARFIVELPRPRTGPRHGPRTGQRTGPRRGSDLRQTRRA